MVGWSANWAWGLPLIVFTVILHSYSLGLLNAEVSTRLKSKERLLIPLPVTSFSSGVRRLRSPCCMGRRVLSGRRLTVFSGHPWTTNLRCSIR
jgi:hypothetical protein